MQFSYNISLNSCQCLLRNYTKVNKFANPKDYEGKIVFLSSSKPKYQALYNKEFNIEIKAAYAKVIIKHCYAHFNKNNHVQNAWSSNYPFANESYSMINVGNFTIDTKSFYSSQFQLQTFVPSKEEIINFEQSAAAIKYNYLSQGYFFDKSFPSKKLKPRINDCTLNDKFVRFDVFKPESISILGVIEKGYLKHFDYYTIDFSGVFDGKITLNSLINNFINGKKQQVFALGLISISILIIFFVLCNRFYFSIFAFVILIVSTLNIKSLCLQYFPIKFKPLFATTLTILMSLAFFYSNKIPIFIKIMLLN